MARGNQPTIRSKTEVKVPREYEYSVPLDEFLHYIGVPANEEIRTMHWSVISNTMFFTTRETSQ